jgi:hypothetical protein
VTRPRMTATRRQLIAAGAAGLAFGPAFWRSALTAHARAPQSAYGPLQPADARGLMLPPGFRSREIARAGRSVAGYPWHVFSDGQSTFATRDGGWILVSNSESTAAAGGGSSAIRFSPRGKIKSAYRILAGTQANCAGGRTPWGTWLSCEEFDAGHVWECDPTESGQGVMRPALGTIHHEAVAVDPVAGQLYMTEDRPDGGFYRFTPAHYPDLSAGRLEIMVQSGWAEVPDPAAIFGPTRRQVAGTRQFDGGEGIWFDSGTVYFSTKGDDRVWAYDTVAGTLGTVYDRATAGAGAPLSGVDNLTVSRAGEIFVCEDGGNMEICVIDPGGTVAPFLRLTGEAAAGLPGHGNELSGVVFAPNGERMYFAAQRAHGFGAIYEVSGPFRAATGAGPGAPVAAHVTTRGGDPAGLRVRVRRRISPAALRRRGVLVEVRLDAPAALRVALRTDDLRRVPGRRGSTARPHTVTLDRRRIATARAGRLRLRLRVSAAEARRLRRAGRPVTLQIAVSARGEDGLTRVTAHRLRLR